MVSPILVNASDTSGATGTEPAGTGPGDGLIAIGYAINSGTPSAPAGWGVNGALISFPLSGRLLVCSIKRGGSAPSYTMSGAGRVLVYAIKAGTYNASLFSETPTSFITSSNTNTYPIPDASPNSGDMVIIFMTEVSSATTITTPAGFTQDFNTGVHASAHGLAPLVAPYTYTLLVAESGVGIGLLVPSGIPAVGGNLPLLGVG